MQVIHSVTLDQADWTIDYDKAYNNNHESDDEGDDEKDEKVVFLKLGLLRNTILYSLKNSTGPGNM